MSIMNILDTRKKTHEVISPEEYLRRFESDPRSVSGAQIVPPKVGSASFGLFRVERETPLYEVDLLNDR